MGLGASAGANQLVMQECAGIRIAHPSTFEDSPIRVDQAVSMSQASSNTLPSSDTEYLYRGVGSRSPTLLGSHTPAGPAHVDAPPAAPPPFSSPGHPLPSCLAAQLPLVAPSGLDKHEGDVESEPAALFDQHLGAVMLDQAAAVPVPAHDALVAPPLENLSPSCSTNSLSKWWKG